MGPSKNSLIHSPLHSLKIRLKRSTSSIGVADRPRAMSRQNSRQIQRPNTTFEKSNRPVSFNLPITPLKFKNQSTLASTLNVPLDKKIALSLPNTPLSNQLAIPSTPIVPLKSALSRKRSIPPTLDKQLTLADMPSSKFILEQINEEDEENVQDEKENYYENVYVNINRNTQQIDEFENDADVGDVKPRIFFSKKILKKVSLFK